MKEQNYEIKSEWGLIETQDNKRTGETIEIRLTKTSWFGKTPKWDIRKWSGDVAGAGIVLSDDGLKKLRDILSTIELD